MTIFRPGVALLAPEIAPDRSALREAFDRLERVVNTWCTEAQLVA